jgi:hypothetical protein
VPRNSSPSLGKVDMPVVGESLVGISKCARIVGSTGTQLTSWVKQIEVFWDGFKTPPSSNKGYMIGCSIGIGSSYRLLCKLSLMLLQQIVIIQPSTYYR